MLKEINIKIKNLHLNIMNVMNNKNYIKIILLLLLSISANAQLEWNTKRNKVKIPFELTHNLIIIDVVVNGVDLKMILDTGSERNLLFSFPENDSIEFYSPKIIKVKGLGYGESLEAIVSSNNKMSIQEESLSDNNFEILLITNQNIGLINKLGIPINGILGSSFFKEFLVEINYSKKKVFLYRDKEKVLSQKAKKYNKISVEITQNKPYVNFEIQNDDKKFKANLLFDSGLSDGLWLFEDDSISCSKNYFNDFLGKGLGGDIMGKKSRVQNLRLNEYKVKDALVSFPDSISVKSLDLIKDRNGSLGGEIIKRFNWYLDYENNIFYVDKNQLFNEPFNYNMSGIEVQHEGVEWIKEITRTTEKSVYNTVDVKEYIYDNPNLKNKLTFTLESVYTIDSVRENSPAYRAGIKEGDKIVSINNKKAYGYTIQKIVELFQSVEGRKIKIEVEREGKILEFEFYLEKIL